MLDPRMTVAQIVSHHPETARIFQNRRIDFCCRGGITVDEACEGTGLDPAAVLAEAEQAVARRDPDEHADLVTLSTPALVARIIDRHHRFLRETLPWVVELSAKVARVHGEHNPKLRDLDEAVRALAADLYPHLDDEEQTLFPALMAGRTDAEVEAALGKMFEEHLAVGELLGRIRAAADDYAIPEWACGSYRTLFSELQAVESDTLRHVHVENHVLRPRFLS